MISNQKKKMKREENGKRIMDDPRQQLADILIKVIKRQDFEGMKGPLHDVLDQLLDQCVRNWYEVDFSWERIENE